MAHSSDANLIRAFYEKWDYKGTLGHDDTIWIAEAVAEPIGVVRVVSENGVLVLRGMRVALQWQRKGIGRQMLSTVAAWLANRDCYCVPYVHLVGFYGCIGFVEVDPSLAPSFLAERVGSYRSRGLDVTLMLRCSSAIGGLN